jgi:predicted  nucleic acid-binding Zn-ribbon protein
LENATSSDTLKRLLDLQRVDTAIDRLMQRKADLPEQRTVDELAAQITEAQAAHAEKKSAFDEIAHEQSRLEGDVQMIDDKIKHESNRLYGGDITSPKELASIQAELDALRRRKNHLEDQDLEVMERREGVENDVSLLEAQLEELRAKAQEATEARDHAAVEIETELNKNTAARAEILPQIPEELLDTYEELRPKKGGVAAAALEGNVCRGCGVSLSPMALDVIKRAEEGELARCENCRRILVRV